jgi:hypothetical protein
MDIHIAKLIIHVAKPRYFDIISQLWLFFYAANLQEDCSMKLAIPDDMLLRNPFISAEQQVLIPSAAMIYNMALSSKRLPIPIAKPIQVHLDGWPDPEIGENVFIRISTQGKGCSFKCLSCDAGRLPGVNLTAEEIAFQALMVLKNYFIDLSKIKKLVIATMGLGEPLANRAVAEAIRMLHELLPEASFIISTSGPRAGRETFADIIRLVEDEIDVNLQISLHTPNQDDRLKAIGDTMHNSLPVMSWTVGELSARANEWLERTARLPVLNCVVGPDYPIWRLSDYHLLITLFPCESNIIKLSLEGPNNGKQWDPLLYVTEISCRDQQLKSLGYETVIYVPPGMSIGGSCGARTADPDQTIQEQLKLAASH